MRAGRLARAGRVIDRHGRQFDTLFQNVGGVLDGFPEPIDLAKGVRPQRLRGPDGVRQHGVRHAEEGRS